MLPSSPSAGRGFIVMPEPIPGGMPSPAQPPLPPSGPPQQMPGPAGTPQAGGFPQQPRPGVTYQSKKPIRIITSRRRSRMLYVEIAVPIIVVALMLVYVFVLPQLQQKVPLFSTTVPTTTVQPAGILSGCEVITQPGSYFLTANVKTSVTNSSCILVSANSVSIVCDGKYLEGSGPYVDVPPFSYAIRVENSRNVSVNGCGISNFSYGVYAQNSPGLRVLNSNFTIDYVSAVYAYNSPGGQISNNYVSTSSSPQGAMVLANDSSNYTVYNNTLHDNILLGLSVQSGNDRFIGDYVSGSRASFVCSPQYGFPFSSYARDNTCYNQTGCGFLTCTGINTPINLTKVVLGSSIQTCGTIRSPGNYSLAGNLNMRKFINFSATSPPPAYSAACIRIDSIGVNLNCDNLSISGAYIGIYSAYPNITVSDCRVYNSTTGMELVNSFNPIVNNTMFRGDNVSLQLVNSSAVQINKINATGSDYGLELLSSAGAVVKNFSFKYNTYGIYLNNSQGSTFVGGTAFNSTRFDVFGGANSNQNIMTETTCYLTNAGWAPCDLHTQGNTTTYLFPLNGCSTVSRPGVYRIYQNIINAVPSCITINSNNVRLNCTGAGIIAQPGTFGAAVVVKNKYNITVSDCYIENYNTALSFTNVTDLAVTDVNMSQPDQYGIVVHNASDFQITYDRVEGSHNVSIYLSGASNGEVEHDNITSGLANNVALLLADSSGNRVESNYGFNNYVGMYLNGTSLNNTIYNNSFSADSHLDYMCSPQSGAVNAEYGGVNTGATKFGCHWLAAIPFGSQSFPCAGASTPSLYSLSADGVYYVGAKCFSLVKGAGGSTINCNGHTILAPAGGTLVWALNAGQITIENCYLKGFGTVIQATNSTPYILNNTVFVNNTQPAGSELVNITDSSGIQIMYNNLSTPYGGIALSGELHGHVEYNNVTALKTAYYVYNSVGVSFIGTSSSPASGLGMLLSNSTFNVFSGVSLNGASGGIACSGTSMGRINNTDGGQNYCSYASGCSWISSSQQTC